MNSRLLSGSSMLGIGVGLLAGAAAGLLMAPMRGSQMRASLRSHADSALDRGMTLVEEGRRAFRTRMARESEPLTAPLAEIAQMHSRSEFYDFGARS
jgi:gas vesicle protein